MIRLLVSLHRAVHVAAIALSLVATGFGHRMPTAADDAALAFAAQNGVSLSDLCGGDLGESANAGPDCQACRITGTADLPPVTGTLVDVELAFQARVIAPLEVRATVPRSDPANRPQGPPVA